MIRLLRTLAYRSGYRPRPGTILYSPSLALIHAARDANIGQAFADALTSDIRKWPAK